MVLSIEERVFVVENVFREGKKYTDLVQEQFAEKFPETHVPHHSAVRRLTEKVRETALVTDAEGRGRPSKLNGEKLMDISDCCGGHQNHCASWRKRKLSVLQQHIKRSEKN